jgi:hypothetical protein
VTLARSAGLLLRALFDRSPYWPSLPAGTLTTYVYNVRRMDVFDMTRVVDGGQ